MKLYHIEFMGLPGVGKTVTRKKLVQRLQLENKDMYLTMEEAFMHVAKSNMDAIYRVIIKSLPSSIAIKFTNKLMNRSLMQYEAQNVFLAKFGKSFESFLASPEFDALSVGDRAILISGFFQIGALYESVNEQLDEKIAVFFEEGFIQKSFMFICHITNEQSEVTHLYNYLENIPMADLIIYIKADLDTCYQRMFHRPQGLTSRLKKVDKDAVYSFLIKSEKHLHNVVSWLRDNKNIHILEINNDNYLDEVISCVQNDVKTYLENDF